ncbi:MAG: uroporphyrinogen III synthase [Lysobacteraceae bacterium]|nr:MAG: uroporphyrinogen III synthase [Xanthomonadaceae bacterium]
MAQAVRARGRRAVVLPLLEIAPLDDTSLLRAALANLPSYALVAFVSPNAVDAAFAHLDGWPAGVPVGVVGEGSRTALARHGVTPENATIHCPPDAASSDSEQLLASLDLSAFAGRRVLIVRGDSGRELMADTLRAAGALVDTVAAYRRSVPALSAPLAAELSALLAGPNDWIITSSEALRGLAGLVRELDPAIGIGQLQAQHLIVPHARIAETARALGCDHVTLTGSGDARLITALFAAVQSQQ